jgi:hypothetical protein
MPRPRKGGGVMARIDDGTDRMIITRKVVEFAEALSGEGFIDEDIIDALLAAAYRRIGDHAGFLDWAKDVAGLEREYAKGNNRSK